MGLRQHKLLIYRLKRTFGQSAIYYVPTSNAHDVTTGAITRTYDSYKLKRAVLMPAEMTREFVYDLAYIAAGKNFTHGAYFDSNTRVIIVSAKDLPKGFVPKIKHHIEFDTGRYEIRSFVEQPSRAFYVFLGKALSNAATVAP